MVQRAKEECGTEMKQTREISMEQEEMLWGKDILGSDTPDKLGRTLFFLIGIHFALRGGKEQKNLRFGENSQFKINYDSEGNKYLQYTQSSAKKTGKEV